MEDAPFTNGGVFLTGTRRETFDQDSSGRDLQQNSPQDKSSRWPGVSQSPNKGGDSRAVDASKRATHRSWSGLGGGYL